MKSYLFLSVFASLAWADRQWITPDFFTEVRTNAAVEAVEAVPTDCRKHIEKVVCVVEVDPPEQEKDPFKYCLGGSGPYVKTMQKLHDRFPSSFRKMFCSLDVVYVIKSFFGTAYAGYITDPSGKPVGTKMGIRKSVIDEKLDLYTWASWKEQLSFGGVKETYTISPGLPRALPVGANDFLFFVVAHEFGHLFDFSNNLNRLLKPDCKAHEPGVECEFHPESWGAMTWKSTLKPLPENDFYRFGDLCFYWCQKPIPAQDAPRLYQELANTTFLSTYATTQAWDDFADSIAYHLMFQRGEKYWLESDPKNRYSIHAKYWSKAFKKKRQYIKKFLQGPKKYPKN